MKIAELAAHLGYEFVGDPELSVRSIAFASGAGECDLAIARSPAEVQQTLAPAVLLAPKIVRTHKTILYCSDSIDLAAVKAARLLMEQGELKAYGAGIVQYQEQPGHIMAGERLTVGEDTTIGPFCVIGEDVQIGRGCIIEPQVQIGSGVHIGDSVTIRSGTKIGAPALYFYIQDGQTHSFPGIGTVRIEDRVEIGCNCVVQRGTFSDTVIGYSSVLGDLVNIGHDVRIGQNCRIVSQVGIAGNAVIGRRVQLFGQVGVANRVTIGDGAVVLAKSLVTKNVKEGKTILGLHGRERREELRLQVKLKKL